MGPYWKGGQLEDHSTGKLGGGVVVGARVCVVVVVVVERDGYRAGVY
jgi:hypothetical protein